MANCTVVTIKNTGERGCIIRRIDAHSYEIWLESGAVVVIPPDEFDEMERRER